MVERDTASKGKIGVLIEDHYDPTEFEMFNEYFPQAGLRSRIRHPSLGQSLRHLLGQPRGWRDQESGQGDRRR